MSRIHDALKRAEQEKATSVVPEGGSGASEVTAADSPRLEGLRSRAAEGLPTAAQPGSELKTDVPVLRTLVERCRESSWNPDPDTTLFFNGQTHVHGTEEFRTLRSRLYLTRKQQPLQKLLITSPLPKEGKTFIAANLARVIVRQPERRVLLVDGDLRFSRLHVTLGASATPGLSDYLSGEADEFSVIQRGPLDNLFFIPGGKSVSNPSELIGNGRLKMLLNHLGPAFDWIILDSPPVIPVSDAKLLAALCDGVLVLILAGKTPYDLAQKACQEFSDRRVLGVVLNQAEAGLAYSSYYYYDQRKPPERE